MTRGGHRFAAALPAITALAIFSPGLVATRTPLLRDLLMYFQPWTEYLVRRLHDGGLPLWNPLLFCGMSIAGQIHNRLYYPAFPIYLAAPYRIAVLVDLVAHVGLAGFFAARLLRRLGVGVAGAAFGAVVMALNGWVLAKFEAPLKVGIYTWFPLALLAFVDASEGRSRRAAITLAAAVGLQLLSGYPPIAAYVIPLECLVGAAILFGARGGARDAGGGAGARRLAPIAAGVVLGALLAAIAIIPLLDEGRRTVYWKPMPREIAFARSLPPSHLAAAALPRHAGLPGLDRFWGGELEDYGAGAIYVGLPALLFAAAAIAAACRRARVGSVEDDARARMRRWATWGLASAAAVALLLALGRHGFLFGLVRDHLPGFAKTRWPTQVLGVATACVGLLAGLGLDACARGAAATREARAAHRGGWGRARTALIAAFAAAAIAALAAAAFAPAQPAATTPPATTAPGSPSEQLASAPFDAQAVARGALQPAYRRGDLLRVALLAGVSAAILALPIRLWLLLAMVAAIDLALLGRTLVPFVDGDLFAERPKLGALAALAGSGERAMRLGGDVEMANTLSGTRNPQVFREARRVLLGVTSLLHELPCADGGDPLRGARNNYLVATLARAKTPPEVRQRVGAALGITWLIEPSGVRPGDFPNLATVPDTVTYRSVASGATAAPVLPFAYLVGTVIELAADDAQIVRLARPDFDPRRAAIVPDAPAGFALAGGADAGAGSCVASRARPERIDVTADAPTDAFLVIRESHDPGWRAFVDGSEVPIVRTNFLLMGVPLHAGEHRVSLRFEPRAYRAGAALSLLAAGALAAIALWPRARR